jgi:hypothetical protein
MSQPILHHKFQEFAGGGTPWIDLEEGCESSRRVCSSLFIWMHKPASPKIVARSEDFLLWSKSKRLDARFTITPLCALFALSQNNFIRTEFEIAPTEFEKALNLLFSKISISVQYEEARRNPSTYG